MRHVCAVGAGIVGLAVSRHLSSSMAIAAHVAAEIAEHLGNRGSATAADLAA